MEKDSDRFIELIQVETNNLKGIDVSFPKEKLTVVTGVSGSGKSSLVFASLFAESQRRYLESLSSFARQYIKSQAKPQIKEARNLPAAIAIKQARALTNNRSTVGSLTEICRLFEVLYYHLSQILCPSCKKTIKPHTTESSAKKIVERFKEDEFIFILAPLLKYQDLNQEALKNELQNLGYSRLWSKEKGLIRTNDLSEKDLSSLFVLIDRVSQNEVELDRVLESCHQAFTVGQNEVFILNNHGDFVCYSKKRKCFDCHLDFTDPQPSLFSYNSSLGACSTCHGYGQSSHINWKKVIPDLEQSISSQGIAALSFGSHTEYYKEIKKYAKKQDLDLKKSFKNYTKKEMKWLYEGDNSGFEGLVGYFAWLEKKKYKPHYRMHLAKFKLYRTCETCSGKRYNEKSLLYSLNHKNIAELLDLKISDLSSWFNPVKKKWKVLIGKASDSEDISSAIEEVESRLNYLEKIGLGYLSASRLSSTLSGGELQRINMARCLGNYLTQTLFCLDEPTSGLHPKDSERLINIMKDLQALGNTVVVVEHERKVIESADHLITIGPKSGETGGEIGYEGPPKDFREEGEFLKSFAKNSSEKFNKFFEIKNIQVHNLKNIHVKFPVGAIIGVCGVSGSGKTSLVRHALYPILKDEVYGTKEFSKPKNLSLTKNVKIFFKDVFFVSQDPITRNSRSTITTYLGIYDEIRKKFAKVPEALDLKLTAKSFSFNSPGGRCEFCKGKGMVAEELSFLGVVDVICEECSGQRFTQDVLKVRYKGYNIFELLSCTIRQIFQLFPESKKIKKVFDQVTDVGLDYITLGQSLSSFSGGEAQRLKLLSLSLLAKEGENSCLIFDEPTSGLSDSDIVVLVKHFKKLQEAGHTLIIIEHHTGLLKSCDYLIELGPGASDKGGSVIFEDYSEKIKQSKKSVMAPYLNEL